MSDVDRKFDSLAHAFRARKTRLENQTFISEMTDAIGVGDIYDRGSYMKLVRRDGGPDLRVAFGWTNGFFSRGEVVAALGDRVVPWPREHRPGPRGVSHPIRRDNMHQH